MNNHYVHSSPVTFITQIRSWLKNVSLIIPAAPNPHFPTHRRELKFSVVNTTKYFINHRHITVQSYRRESVNINCLLQGKSIYRLFLNINQLDALNFIISLFQASTRFEHMCSSSGGQKLYYTVSGIITATYRCDDTRDCIIQFLPS